MGGCPDRQYLLDTKVQREHGDYWYNTPFRRLKTEGNDVDDELLQDMQEYFGYPCTLDPKPTQIIMNFHTLMCFICDVTSSVLSNALQTTR